MTLKLRLIEPLKKIKPKMILSELKLNLCSYMTEIPIMMKLKIYENNN
mgnify:CR=1 FL=1